MRILYLHQYFTLPLDSGGTRSYEFAKRWIANGHDVHIITSSVNLPAEYRGIKDIQRTHLAGIPVSIIPSNYSPHMNYAQRILSFIRFALEATKEVMRQEADVIYASSTPLTIAVPAILGKLKQRIPLVMEIRDLWPEIPIAMGALKNPILQQAAYLLEWVAYHTSSHIVALSPNMADGVMRRGISREHITVVPNASDIAFFANASVDGKSVREKLGIGLDQPLIVYTGAFGYVNGLSYLVEVAAKMQEIDANICFLLVGGGVERTKILNLAEKSQVLNKSLWVWDAQPKTEIPGILAAATVATSTVINKKELWNNSANKFFDALAASVPIAINHGGWLADLLHESGAGLVLPPDNPEEAAYKLAAFVNNVKHLEKASEEAYKLACSRFNRDDLSQTVETILANVVSKYR